MIILIYDVSSASIFFLHGSFVFSRILVDTGDKDISDYQKNLAEVVQAEQVNIEHIVVTHWHHDHIGGVENLYGNIARKNCTFTQL